MKFFRFWPWFLLAVVVVESLRNGHWQALAIAVPIGLIVGILLIPATMQNSLLKMTASSEPRDTHLEEWPQLDRAAWEETARGWRELGFEPRATWSWGEKNPRLSVVVSQLWERPEKDALVEISQTFLPQGALPVTTAALSFWGDGGELELQSRALETPIAPIAAPLPVAPPRPVPNSESLPIHSYGTHNRVPSWILNLLIHPQMMGTRCSRAAPDELWQTHITRRAAISQVLQQPPLSCDLVSLVRAQSRVTRALWHRRLKRKFYIQLWRAWRRGTSQTETWGELETKLRAIHDETGEKPTLCERRSLGFGLFTDLTFSNAARCRRRRLSTGIR